MRELGYAENSQSVSQQTGSSGWLRRKTGGVCRTRNFAASQSKNRLPHLGEFAGAFRKIVYQSRRSKLHPFVDPNQRCNCNFALYCPDIGKVLAEELRVFSMQYADAFGLFFHT